MTLPTVAQLDHAAEWLVAAGAVVLIPALVVGVAVLIVAWIITVIRHCAEDK